MYSVNTCTTPVLITPDECMRQFSGNKLDPNIWSSSIEIAEERFVRPVLGDDLYNDICSEKNILLTSGNLATYQDLINTQNGANAQTLQVGWYINAYELFANSGNNTNYASLWTTCLWKFCYEAVFFVALAENYVKMTDSGVIKNNPTPGFIDSNSSQGTSAGANLKDIKYMRDDTMLQRISIMRDKTINYLYDNYALFPLYPQKLVDQTKHHKNSSHKDSFINIYDDDDCRHRGHNEGGYYGY